MLQSKIAILGSKTYGDNSARPETPEANKSCETTNRMLTRTAQMAQKMLGEYSELCNRERDQVEAMQKQFCDMLDELVAELGMDIVSDFKNLRRQIREQRVENERIKMVLIEERRKTKE
jgi:hypothetical protein